MELTPVESSHIAAIGYDPVERRLRIVFKTSGAYDYDDVPPEAHHALMKAESIGKHFCAHIKPHFSASKLAAAE